MALHRTIAITLGACLTGAALSPAGWAQQPQPAPVAQPAASAAAPTATGVAVHIGAIDMDKAFEGYKKADFIREQIKQAIIEKNGELTRKMTQMRELAKKLEGLDPLGNDYKTAEGQITQLKAEYEAGREMAQAEFSRRDAEALATIYKDIQDMSARVARSKGLHFVVKVTNEPPSGSDPNSVLAAMSHSVLFHDPSLDITNIVVYNLNLQYESQQGPAAATSSTAPAAAPADRATVPASATAAPGR